MTTNLTPLKFCRDCVHLLGVRHRTESSDQWKCIHPKNVIDKKFDLVNGNIVWSLRYPTCAFVRDIPPVGQETCSPEGEWFEEYVKPDFINTGAQESTPPKKSKFNAEDL